MRFSVSTLYELGQISCLHETSQPSVMFTPWLRLDARHLTHAAHLPNQKDGGHHFARHLTHAAHLLNRRMVNCDSLSKYYLRPMGLATQHMQPTSSTRRMVNCQVQPSVEMDGQVKSWSVSSLCGRQHHHVPCQVGQSLYFRSLKTKWFMIVFSWLH